MVKNVINVNTGKRLAIAIVVAISFVGVIADMITIGQFGVHLWELPRREIRSVESVPTVQAAPQQPAITPTASPTPVPPLGRQLEEALAVSNSTARNEALFIVAQDAVIRSDYWTAIRAASASPSASYQARNLSVVVRCAIEDGKHDVAADAAAKKRNTTSRDQMRIEVISARKEAQTAQISPAIDDREKMVCLD